MHTRCFHSSQHCREPWSWLLSWEQSALHTWLHPSCGGVSWLVVLVRKILLFHKSQWSVSHPRPLCYLNLSTFEGFDEIEINKAPVGRFCLGWVKRLATSYWPLDKTPYKAKVQEETQDPLFWSNFCILCRTKMIKLYQKRALCYYLSSPWCF